MKTTSIFKKSAVFATAMFLVLIMAISVVPMASATEEPAKFDTQIITDGNTSFGEKLAAMNVSQAGDITMLFYFTALDNLGDDDYIEITVPQQKGKDAVVKTIKKGEITPDEKGRYPVQVTVAAAQQTDLVKLQWVDAETGNKGKSREYSVKYYADEVLRLAAAGNEKYIPMVNNVKSMLNYGAYAQIVFNHNTDKLANFGIYGDVNPIDNMTVDNLYDANVNEAVETENIKFVAAQAFLQDRIQLRVYFTAPDDATANILKNGESVAEDVNIGKDEFGKYVNVNNVAAHNFDTEYTIEVTNGEETATRTYSVLEYALDMINSNATAAQKNAAKAIYLYYAWSKNYMTAESYLPGPKNESGAVVCSHERSHFEDAQAICSDCGAKVDTRLGLTAEYDGELVAGEAKDITFNISIAGNVDLSTIAITLNCYNAAGEKIENALTFVEDSAIYGGENSNIGGEIDRNIIIDTVKPLTDGCTLVTVTYTVNVAESGICKIVPVVQQAFNGSGNKITTITPSITVIETK